MDLVGRPVEGGGEDLDESILLDREAISLRPTGHVNHAKSINNLANNLSIRFRLKAESFADLEESLMMHRKALSLRPVPDPERSQSLHNLSIALSLRFHHKGNIQNIQECSETRVAATCYLVRALLTRFAYHGLVTDLDKCIECYFKDGLYVARSLEAFMAWMRQGENNCAGDVDVASGLIVEYRHSIGTNDLNPAISLATSTLSACATKGASVTQLLIALGNAYVVRYMQQGEWSDLDEAVKSFHEAKKRPVDAALAIQSLGHAGWVLFTECGKWEGIHEATKSVHDATEEDKEGMWAYHSGTKLLMVGDPNGIDDAVSFLRASLEKRKPGHPRRISTLGNLTVGLLSSFKRQGRIEDLDESISICRESIADMQPPHPGRYSVLNNLGNNLCARYEHQNSFNDLEECISIHREALTSLSSGHPSRSQSLNNLANALWLRFLRNDDLRDLDGNFEDLEEAIKLHRKVLKLQLPPHPDRHMSLNGLATELRIRFDHKGNSDDLEQSIAYNREALSLQSPCHPHRCSSLAALGNALRTRFSDKGGIRDIEEAIQVQQEALISRPAPHPDRPDLLNDLATAFSAQYNHSGDFKDLDESILLDREAISLRPTGHVNRAQSISNLANNLGIRFDLKAENFADVEEALMMHREALSLRPVPDPERSQSLHNLSVALSVRFHHKGDIQDIQESVTLGKEALKIRPSPHPQRPQTLSNLVANRRILYQHKKNFEDLEQCISFNEEALAAVPEGHPGRFQFLHNLASSLLLLFTRTGDLEDLKKSISLYRQVTSLLPTQHYQRPKALTGLSEALFLRLEHRKDKSTEDINESIALSEEALSLTPSHSHNYNKCLANLASNLHMRFHDSGNNEDLERAYELWEKAAKSNTGPLLLRLSRKAAALEAYRYAIELLPLLASVDLTMDQRQALQLRTPLAELEAVDKGFAESLRTISRQLEVETQGPIDYDLKMSTSPSRTIDSLRLYSLSQEREKLLRRIREIDGLQGFMRPGSFDALKEASRNGPIVFLNASELGCDAVIMRPGGQLERVPFLKINYKLLQELKVVVQNLAQGKNLQHEAADTLEKLHTRGGDHDGSRKPTREDPQNTITVNDRFRQVLGMLWVNIVKPIIDALGLKKTDKPPKLWWCPIGPFVFLPIHAAGIYSAKRSSWEADECLSDFAISSYCYSPQNLLSDTPKVPVNFKMLAVLEPEGMEAARGLPMTEVELEKIRDRIPSPDHLITRLGSRASPNATKMILDDIHSLLLSGGELTMSRIIRECQQSSTACLAYLSACETAMGDVERPDESLNLAATMMFSGFRSVVGTMWSIADDDAPIVADVFYGHLFRKGKASPPDSSDAAESLHLSVKELRRLGRDFKRWVPFVHFGI
ncbi:TPR-like protein [Coprinopsis marcescibilis]|uniref:TPR-like protein n=1 Tax=Coprinopsis marcescibilis TaxID=230819 RepID=A0A5C3KAH8_COPMA|nr:TPR-like protein [Coprinopsis marcescibilis]